MKKYFISGVLAIATALTGAVVLTSCSHDVTYSEEDVQQAKHAEAVAKYQQSFVNLLGQPTANQCWDFTKGGSFTTTRGASDNNVLSQWPSYSAYLNGYNSEYATGGNDPLPQGDLSSKVVKKADNIKAAIELAANDPEELEIIE